MAAGFSLAASDVTAIEANSDRSIGFGIRLPFVLATIDNIYPLKRCSGSTQHEAYCRFSGVWAKTPNMGQLLVITQELDRRADNHFDRRERNSG